MNYQQKTDSGTVFYNDRKERENQPDFRGTLDVGGKPFWISMWKKRSLKTGEEFFSISVQPKLQSDKASPPTGGKNDPRPEQSPFDDDTQIPF